MATADTTGKGTEDTADTIMTTTVFQTNGTTGQTTTGDIRAGNSGDRLIRRHDTVLLRCDKPYPAKQTLGASDGAESAPYFGAGAVAIVYGGHLDAGGGPCGQVG
jgi:hypothetical protein